MTTNETLDTATWNDMMALRRHLIGVLRDGFKMPRDLDDELRLLAEAANAWALTHPDKCKVVTMGLVRNCDASAMGHIDWFQKLTLYVAEATYGLGPWKCSCDNPVAEAAMRDRVAHQLHCIRGGST